MPTNITDINDARHLGELDPIYVLQGDSMLLARTNGVDNRMPFEYLYKQVIDIAKTADYNHGYNADFLNGVAVDTENTSDQRVLMYLDAEQGYIPVDLKPNHIDWSDFDQNDFVKIDTNGQLVPSDIFVTDLKPTGISSAGRFLQVDESGTNVIESNFDLDNFLNYPNTSSQDANFMGSGIFVAGYSTANRDGADQSYIISSRLRNDPEVVVPRAAQLSISTDSDTISFRRNDGTLTVDNFTRWCEIYHELNHPISDQISNASSSNIASSKAVKNVNDKLDQLIANYNGSEILARIITVDGSGSGLDADRIDGYEFTDLDARFVNVAGDNIDGTLIVRNGNKVRFSKGTSYADIKAEDANTLFDSNNPVSFKNGSQNQRIYSGGLLVSNNFSQANLIPSNGIYSVGKITSNVGIDVGSTAVVDSAGKISWTNLKGVPPRVNNLGSVAERDVGSEPEQVPRNADILTSLLPSGAVVPFAGNTSPDGWLVCDGSAVSRTQYAGLYNYIGTLYGAGNGSTTFNIPDMRNEFVRGASTTREVGAKESDEIKSHSHSGSTNTTGNHNHSGSTSGAGSHRHDIGFSNYAGSQYGETTVSNNNKEAGWGSAGVDKGSAWTSSVGNHTHSLSLNANGNHSHGLTINSTGGSETRPRNIVLLYCIKY